MDAPLTPSTPKQSLPPLLWVLMLVVTLVGVYFVTSYAGIHLFWPLAAGLLLGLAGFKLLSRPHWRFLPAAALSGGYGVWLIGLALITHQYHLLIYGAIIVSACAWAVLRPNVIPLMILLAIHLLLAYGDIGQLPRHVFYSNEHRALSGRIIVHATAVVLLTISISRALRKPRETPRQNQPAARD